MNLRKGKIIVVIILLLILALAAFDLLTHTYIKAEFLKTDPMPARMGVYFQGYKLGTTTKINISNDFKKTYLFITLNQRGLHLPRNIKAEVKNYDEDAKFVDLIYPTRPAIRYLRTGDVIKGRSKLHGADGISNTNQAHLDNLSEKGENLLNSAKETTDTLTDLFALIHEILSENRQNILSSSNSLKNSMSNLEITTDNLKEISTKTNSEISSDALKNIISNIEQTTTNLSESTSQFVSVSGNLNKTSSNFSVLIPKLKELIDIGKTTLCNLNSILTGLGETLRKRCGGMRVLFGVPINE